MKISNVLSYILRIYIHYLLSTFSICINLQMIREPEDEKEKKIIAEHPLVGSAQHLRFHFSIILNACTSIIQTLGKITKRCQLAVTLR